MFGLVRGFLSAIGLGGGKKPARVQYRIDNLKAKAEATDDVLQKACMLFVDHCYENHSNLSWNQISTKVEVNRDEVDLKAKHDAIQASRGAFSYGNWLPLVAGLALTNKRSDIKSAIGRLATDHNWLNLVEYDGTETTQNKEEIAQVLNAIREVDRLASKGMPPKSLFIKLWLIFPVAPTALMLFTQFQFGWFTNYLADTSVASHILITFAAFFTITALFAGVFYLLTVLHTWRINKQLTTINTAMTSLQGRALEANTAATKAAQAAAERLQARVASTTAANTRPPSSRPKDKRRAGWKFPSFSIFGKKRKPAVKTGSNKPSGSAALVKSHERRGRTASQERDALLNTGNTRGAAAAEAPKTVEAQLPIPQRTFREFTTSRFVSAASSATGAAAAAQVPSGVSQSAGGFGAAARGPVISVITAPPGGHAGTAQRETSAYPSYPPHAAGASSAQVGAALAASGTGGAQPQYPASGMTGSLAEGSGSPPPRGLHGEVRGLHGGAGAAPVMATPAYPSLPAPPPAPARPGVTSAQFEEARKAALAEAERRNPSKGKGRNRSASAASGARKVRMHAATGVVSVAGKVGGSSVFGWAARKLWGRKKPNPQPTSRSRAHTMGR